MKSSTRSTESPHSIKQRLSNKIGRLAKKALIAYLTADATDKKGPGKSVPVKSKSTTSFSREHEHGEVGWQRNPLDRQVSQESTLSASSLEAIRKFVDEDLNYDDWYERMEGVYISNRDADVRVSLIYANASCRRHHFASKHFHPGAGLLLAPSKAIRVEPIFTQSSTMSSTPVTPRTRSESQDDGSPPLSSPPSSPPSMPPSEDEEKDADYDPKAEAAMRKEEERLVRDSRRRQTKNKKKPVWDTETEKQNYEKLDVFMTRSLGFSGAIMAQLKQALQGRKAETNPQPKLISGGKMREYQLEGLTWLSCLYEVGLNGILADEMGLGKTVQLISFLAFLREQRTFGPFLVLGPLSTVTNWVSEFKRWAPKIPVVMYHGTPQTRTQMRKQQLKGNASGEKFPVVCTSYEICMRDKKYLANIQWKFIVVDEGHRLKNFNCKLVKELKQYPADSRMILTGTPLQNNLTELWSLLNFLLPQAFSDLEQFEAAFDLSDSHDKDGEDTVVLKSTKRKEIINSLHSILKPFLLRRVKADVEHNLPKKREYILYAPLTPLQKEIYRKIKEGNIRTYLEEKAIERISGVNLDAKPAGAKRKAPGSGKATPSKSHKSSRDSTPANSIRRTQAKRKTYAEVSDAQFFKHLEDDDDASSNLSSAEPSSPANDDDSNAEEQNRRAARRE
ncbi:MAG: hypothetical protein LQ341_005407, partial [Variospora aurantia]